MTTQLYLSDRDLAARYGVNRITIWRWAAQDLIPKPLKIGPATTRWRLSEIEAVEAERVPGGQAA